MGKLSILFITAKRGRLGQKGLTLEFFLNILFSNWLHSNRKLAV